MLPSRGVGMPLTLLLLCNLSARAQDSNIGAPAYPSKPVRIVVTEAGGAVDFMARLLAPGLTVNLGQQVIVEPRGGGAIAGEVVARAAADGYTLLAYGSTFWIGSLLQSTSYDPVRDFTPITLATKSPTILVVHPSLPVKSVKELVALAKAKPGQLNYASAGTGAINHLAAEVFKAMAGVNIERVAYRGTGAAISALIGGQVQIMFPGASTVAQHIKAGRLRALAVTSAEPSALIPGLPAAAATIPGYEAVAMQGLFAPAKTPAAVVSRLNKEMVTVLNKPDVKERFFASGSEIVGSSPEQFAAVIKSEMARLAKLIKEGSIRAE